MQERRLCVALGERQVADPKKPQTSNVVKSAARVLEILELFDNLRRDATVSEISYVLELPQSSTSVLLRSMADLGYLHYDGVKRAYGLTPKVAFLGSWLSGSAIVDGSLLRLIQTLNRITKESVVIAIRNQIWSHYIHVTQATRPNRIFIVNGARQPLTHASTGTALLTGLDDREVSRIAVRINSEESRNTGPVGISALLDRVSEARRCGYAVCDSNVRTGGMVAMRIPSPSPGDQLVIGVGRGLHSTTEEVEALVALMTEQLANYAVSIGLSQEGNGASDREEIDTAMTERPLEFS